MSGEDAFFLTPAPSGSWLLIQNNYNIINGFDTVDDSILPSHPQLLCVSHGNIVLIVPAAVGVQTLTEEAVGALLGQGAVLRVGGLCMGMLAGRTTASAASAAAGPYPLSLRDWCLNWCVSPGASGPHHPKNNACQLLQKCLRAR